VTACISVSRQIFAEVYDRVAHGQPLPTREADEVGRVYFLAPLFKLAGTGVFELEGVEIQYFTTHDEAKAWAEADIVRRDDEQRAAVRALVMEGLGVNTHDVVHVTRRNRRHGS
jgi:hypothetical protein